MKLFATINASTKKAIVTIDGVDTTCPCVKQSTGRYCVNVAKTTWVNQWVSIPLSAEEGLVDGYTFEKDSDELRTKSTSNGTANSGKIWNSSIELRLTWFEEFATSKGFDVTTLVESIKEVVKKEEEETKSARELEKLEKLEAEIKEKIAQLRK